MWTLSWSWEERVRLIDLRVVSTACSGDVRSQVLRVSTSKSEAVVPCQKPVDCPL